MSLHHRFATNPQSSSLGAIHHVPLNVLLRPWLRLQQTKCDVKAGYVPHVSQPTKHRERKKCIRAHIPSEGHSQPHCYTSKASNTVTDFVDGQRLGLPQAAVCAKGLLLKEEGNVAGTVQEVLVGFGCLRRTGSSAGGLSIQKQGRKRRLAKPAPQGQANTTGQSSKPWVIKQALTLTLL